MSKLTLLLLAIMVYVGALCTVLIILALVLVSPLVMLFIYARQSMLNRMR
jgi:uncharacterized membrane protein